MTVASTTNRKEYAGDDATTSFATSPVVFFDTSDLLVYVTLDSTGVPTLKTEGTHYTASGGDGSTGSVSLAGGSSPHGALLSGTTLVIVRELPLTQEAEFVNGDDNDAEVTETAFDKGTMMLQQLDARISRALVLPDGDVSGASTELPIPVASTLIGWDDDGLALQNYATGELSAEIAVSAFMETVLDDSSATTARATLGLVIGTDVADTGAVTATGITMTTARLLGRTTASTGAVEEISVGASLTLSGGVLSGTAMSDTQAGVVEAAIQSEMETASSTTLTVTPGRQHFHPGMAKFWAHITYSGATPTLAASYNVAGIVDDGPGLVTVIIATDFSSAAWCPVISAGGFASGSTTYSHSVEAQTAGTVQILTQRADGTDVDLAFISVAGFGDMA